MRYGCSPEKFVNLKMTRLGAISLKFLVVNSAKHLEKELKAIIPGSKDFFSNFEAFNFQKIVELKESAQDFGSKKVWNLCQHYLAKDNQLILDQELVIMKWNNQKLSIIEEFNIKKEKRIFFIIS